MQSVTQKQEKKPSMLQRSSDALKSSRAVNFGKLALGIWIAAGAIIVVDIAGPALGWGFKQAKRLPPVRRFADFAGNLFGKFANALERLGTKPRWTLAAAYMGAGIAGTPLLVMEAVKVGAGVLVGLGVLGPASYAACYTAATVILGYPGVKMWKALRPVIHGSKGLQRADNAVVWAHDTALHNRYVVAAKNFMMDRTRPARTWVQQVASLISGAASAPSGGANHSLASCARHAAALCAQPYAPRQISVKALARRTGRMMTAIQRMTAGQVAPADLLLVTRLVNSASPRRPSGPASNASQLGM